MKVIENSLKNIFLQVSRVENAKCAFSQQSVNAASCSRKPENMEMCKTKHINFSNVSYKFHVLSNSNSIVLCEAVGRYFSFNQTWFILPKSFTRQFFNCTSLKLSRNQKNLSYLNTDTAWVLGDT